MPAQTILGGINQEVSQRELIDTLLLMVSQLTNNQPRLDSADRMLVSLAEVNTAITTVTTVTTLSTAGASSRALDFMPMHMANSGAAYIYDNIKIT